MPEWKVGKAWDYGECPVTARSKYGNEDIELSIADGHLLMETEVGYGGMSYNSCSHSVSPSVPLAVLIELLAAHGYEVKKCEG